MPTRAGSAAATAGETGTTAAPAMGMTTAAVAAMTTGEGATTGIDARGAGRGDLIGWVA